jgi:hypothetical protein
VIPWGVIARILLRIGGALLLNRVVEALKGLGHHPPAAIDATAGDVFGLQDPEPVNPEDENLLGCPETHDRWGGGYDDTPPCDYDWDD